MIDFAHGEANRWRHDLLPYDSALSDTARASLANAVERFEAIRKQVQTPEPRGALPTAALAGAQAADLAIEQILTLSGTVELA